MSGALPDWFGSNEGIDGAFFDDGFWEPLSLTAQSRQAIEVGCCDRKYRCGPTPFIDEVFSGGVSLLAKPMRLIVKTDRRTVPLASAGRKLLAKSTEKAVFRHELKGEDLTVFVDSYG